MVCGSIQLTVCGRSGWSLAVKLMVCGRRGWNMVASNGLWKEWLPGLINPLLDHHIM
jgi:hypothetical protein